MNTITRKLSVLLLPVLLAGTATAQSPGGVTSPELWFKTVPQSARAVKFYLNYIRVL